MIPKRLLFHHMQNIVNHYGRLLANGRSCFCSGQSGIIPETKHIRILHVLQGVDVNLHISFVGSIRCGKWRLSDYIRRGLRRCNVQHIIMNGYEVITIQSFTNLLVHIRFSSFGVWLDVLKCDLLLCRIDLQGLIKRFEVDMLLLDDPVQLISKFLGSEDHGTRCCKHHIGFVAHA